tara:strand:+ start:218 stop:703 length:486 start_codon:yes stop_codon:yes gene_type:complete
MANVNKTSFAVSVTPKMQMDNVDNVNQAIDVINENVRTSLGGSGEITGDDTTVAGGWNNGTNTAVTSNGSLLAFDTNTDLIFIKHTGKLFGTTTDSSSSQTVKVALDASETAGVTADTVFIAELANGEAMVIPRPGIAGGYILVTGSGSNHVGVETLIVGT